ncbi:MAG: hypothetical protein MJ065_09000 [Oscillospiraceae bacterium]|nr:hypothetical protein [Oscillospiraceae bacterium]
MELKTITAPELLKAVQSGKLFFSKLKRNPEQAAVFRKYGGAEKTAELIRQGSSDVFFDNRALCMTNEYLIDRNTPETFLLLKDALAAYGEVHGGGEYLIVHDRWGERLRYPFSAGQKQIFRLSILIDKIKRAAPNCRTSHRPEDLEYVRQHTVPLGTE